MQKARKATTGQVMICQCYTASNSQKARQGQLFRTKVTRPHLKGAAGRNLTHDTTRRRQTLYQLEQLIP